MMNTSRKLVLSDILDLRAYERVREERRVEIIEIKRRRRVHLGTVVTLMFENRATMQSQIHEMMRAEKVVNDEQILEELHAYNPLIPEAGQLSATLFIELTTTEQMLEWLPKLVNIESSIAIQLSDGSTVMSIAEESHAEMLTRDNVTAAVHYIRFEFTPEQVELFGAGEVEILSLHPAYVEVSALPKFVVDELLTDLRN
jgi:Protein of unknown function (DUF3501)